MTPSGPDQLTRSDFLRRAGAAAAALAVGAATAPAAFAGPHKYTRRGLKGSLSVVQWTHVVPAYDTWFDQWAKDWGTKNNVEVQADHILSSDLAAKNAAEVAAGGGHDLYKLTRNGEPILYYNVMVDVSDLTKQIGEARGGWIPFAETLGFLEGAWHAVPEYFIDFPALYRKDIFDANGLAPVDTWDDLMKAGTLLKSKGNPIGVAEYRLQAKLPPEFKGKLPSPKQLQDLVRGVLPGLKSD